MRNVASYLLTAAAAAICACATSQRGGGGPALTSAGQVDRYRSVASFDKKEVSTRRWTTTDGQQMELIDFKIQEVPGRNTLAIASYGDKAAGRACCLDIYEYAPAMQPSEAVLFLLCHDARKGWVEDFRVEQSGGDVLLRIARERPGSSPGRVVRNLYAYRYEKSGIITRTPGDLSSEP